MIVAFLLALSYISLPIQAKITHIHKAAFKIQKKKYANRRLLILYKKDVLPQNINKAHFSVGAHILKSFEFSKNIDVVEVGRGISLDAAQDFYRDNPDVLDVEPDYEYRALNSQNDPKLFAQWGLNSDLDKDINASEMWELIKGDENYVIGVLDTGVNYLHKDLKENILINSDEIPNNNIDDDNNGVIDDVFGYNAINNSGDPMDDNGHGSHCAGIIAARGNNAIGGSGVMQEAKILACKSLDENGRGSASHAIACLDYMRKRATNLVATSNSWGGPEESKRLREAIEAHQQQGILFISAASNDGENNDEVDLFPANYDLPNIISVAAFDQHGELADFSNYGKRSVHVGAPGVEILSTVLGNSYESMDGTSMAAPFVAGLAGILKAKKAELSFIEIKNLLLSSGIPEPSLQNTTITGRRIRALDHKGFGALSCENQIVTSRIAPFRDHVVIPLGQVLALAALNINCAQAHGEVDIILNNNNNIKLFNNSNTGIYNHEWIAAKPGYYTFEFPHNDIVYASVYDPASMKKYEVSEETLDYRHILGVPLQARDEYTKSIDTPFPIAFGGGSLSFRKIIIDSNGTLSFTEQKSPGFDNQELPLKNFASLIAPFWDDLSPSSLESDIFYETLGQAPHREFIIEWRKISHYESSGTITFQVVFFEQSSDILFNYLDINFDDKKYNNNLNATIGIQTHAQLSTDIQGIALHAPMALRWRVIP
jgi:subtilisin family serine protease